MSTVIIQAGHQNIGSNCEADLQSGTGAPGEFSWTPQIADQVVALLKAAGVDARHVDANFNCDPAVKQDYDAVVAIHYQSDPPAESGFWCGVGSPSADGAAHASWELQQAVIKAYGAATGLQLRPNWDSINITGYYLFNTLSGPTPFCLIECGTGAPAAPDHELLWSHMDEVAHGIAQGVADYLGVALPLSTPPPPPATIEDRVHLATAVSGRVFTSGGAVAYHWESLPTVAPVSHLPEGSTWSYVDAVKVGDKWYDRLMGAGGPTTGDWAVLDEDFDTAVDGQPTDPAWWRTHEQPPAPPPPPVPTPPPPSALPPLSDDARRQLAAQLHQLEQTLLGQQS